MTFMSRALRTGSLYWSARPLLARVAFAIAFAAVVAFALLALSQLANPYWWSQDTDAYWNAALRLRAGEPLYPPLGNPDASDTYRYAPWFAFAWVPLTFLPQPLVYGAWLVLLGTATVACLWLTLRRWSAATLLAAILFGSLLVPAAASGNVQPLLIAALAFSVERRSGPVWIAAAASLKAAPLLLVAVYLGRREWARAGVTIVFTTILVMPMLAFDLSSYPTQTAAAAGPLPPWIALAAVLVASVAAIRLATTRLGWLLAAAAVMLAIPRWSYYQPSFLLLGAPARAAKVDEQ
jgi:hypothetical protein